MDISFEAEEGNILSPTTPDERIQQVVDGLSSSLGNSFCKSDSAVLSRLDEIMNRLTKIEEHLEIEAAVSSNSPKSSAPLGPRITTVRRPSTKASNTEDLFV